MDGHESYTMSVLAETRKGRNVADWPAGELLSVDCSTQHCAIVVYKPTPPIATAGAMMVRCTPFVPGAQLTSGVLSHALFGERRKVAPVKSYWHVKIS